MSHSTFPEEIEEPLLSAVKEFAALANFRRLWKRKRDFYPASFRELVDAFVEEEELSVLQAAPEYSGGSPSAMR